MTGNENSRRTRNTKEKGERKRDGIGMTLGAAVWRVDSDMLAPVIPSILGAATALYADMLPHLTPAMDLSRLRMLTGNINTLHDWACPP